MREPAPPYVGEGPHALWHVSEDAVHRALRAARQRDGVERGAACLGGRHAAPSAVLVPARVPARRPSGRRPGRRPADAELLRAGRVGFTSSRRAGSRRCATRRVVAYRLPEETFAPDPEVGGYWLSRERGRAARGRRARRSRRAPRRAGIELRVVPNLWPTWNRVVASTLEFSGIRLHNACRASA